MARQKKKNSCRKLGLILAGGLSRRLYPVQTPKPLLKTADGKTLLEEAISRLKGFDVYIVVNAQIALEIKKYFRSIKKPAPQFLIEPEGRDTAAAVGFGLTHAPGSYDWVSVLSADHWMPKTKLFPKFLKTVEREVKKFPDSLFVAGSPKNTKESSAHSSFGWILPGVKKGKSSSVRSFVEKPTGAKLDRMRSLGGLINAGMFFGNFQTFVRAYVNHYPQLFDSRVRYKNLPRLPIDRAIFEKFENVRVVEQPLLWEDLGTWADWKRNRQLPQLTKKGPWLRGDMKSNIVVSSGLCEISVFGLKDIVVVEDGGRLLVMPLSQAKDLKILLESSDVKK